MGLQKKNPSIIGKEVPNDSSRRNEAVSPAVKTCDRVEKKKADNPKPEMTRPVVEPR